MKGRVLLSISVLVVSISVLVVGVLIFGSLGLYVANASVRKARAPEEVVNSFYEAYLESIDLSSEGGNPLVSRAYRDNPYLHPEFVEAVDALLVSFENADQPGGYDPFLLAQDVPESVTVAEVATFDDIAHVRVTTSFEGHEHLVTLTRLNGKWRVLAVNPMPEHVVASFYNWYIRYDGNPLVDGAYAGHPNLTEGYVARIDASLAAMKAENQGGADPILLAQDVPVKIRAEAGALAGTEATVKLELIWGGNPSPSERTVTLRFEDHQWKIDGIAMVD